MKGSQERKILHLLKKKKNRWVSLTQILRMGIAQYNARIFELRAKKHKIENKTEWVGRVKHSWFRLVIS